jgi:hypothetical protein
MATHWGVRTALFVDGALAVIGHAMLIRRARRQAGAAGHESPTDHP